MKVGSTGFLLSSAALRQLKGGLQPEEIQGQPPLTFWVAASQRQRSTG
jgi:hypothetical protein